MNTPSWAQDLIQDACSCLQSKGIETNVPDIKWRRSSNHKYSSGCCLPSHITITAGKDRVDCKLVILHELAHWALPITRLDRDLKCMLASCGNPFEIIAHEGHTSRFWDLAWQLYREFKLPIRYCKVREAQYRKGSLVAYHRSRRAIKQKELPAHQSPGNHRHK